MFVCFEKKSFLEHTNEKKKRFQRGATQTLASFFERFENALVSRDRETRTERDTHRQRDDRDLTLETSDRGRFSLSLSA